MLDLIDPTAVQVVRRKRFNNEHHIYNNISFTQNTLPTHKNRHLHLTTCWCFQSPTSKSPKDSSEHISDAAAETISSASIPRSEIRTPKVVSKSKALTEGILTIPYHYSWQIRRWFPFQLWALIPWSHDKKLFSHSRFNVFLTIMALLICIKVCLHYSMILWLHASCCHDEPLRSLKKGPTKYMCLAMSVSCDEANSQGARGSHSWKLLSIPSEKRRTHRRRTTRQSPANLTNMFCLDWFAHVASPNLSPTHIVTLISNKHRTDADDIGR